MMDDKQQEQVISKEEKKKETQFTKYRGKIKDLYGNDASSRNRGGLTNKVDKLTDIYKKDAYEVFADVLKNPDTAHKISEAAYYASNPYASIIEYYKTFFYIRYTVTPKIIGGLENIKDFNNESGQNKNNYGIIYNRMVNSVEGVNFETLLPIIIEQTLIKGKCGIITEKDKKSETVITTFLPAGYFKTIGKTQFNTNIIAFDYKYFDQLKSSFTKGNSSAVKDADFDKLVESMPKLLQEGYREYLKDTTHRWLELDAKFATEFKFNELGIPAKLGAYPASADYNRYKSIELENAAQQLDHLFTHQIPVNADGDLIMDIDEAIQVAKEMRNSIKEIPNIKVVTTFGNSQLHNLKTNTSEQSQFLDSAYNNIFNSSGVDYHVFISDKDLEVSLKRDKAFIWNFLQVVMNFYNVTINNLLSFKPYQACVDLLPITVQMEGEEIGQYLSNAGSGIGRLQAVVATGMKQSNLREAAILEDYLQLDKILKPLQSMYTTSHKEGNKTSNKEEKETDTDIKPSTDDVEEVE